MKAAVNTAWGLLDAGALGQSQQAFEDALAALGPDCAELRVRCWAGLGQIAAREGRWLAALTLLKDAAKLAQAAQVSPSTALIDLTALHTRLGDAEQALAAADEAVAVYRARSEWRRLTQALSNRGHARLCGGDPASAIADLSAALSLAVEHALPRHRGHAMAVLVQALSEAGRLDEARSLLAALEAWMPTQEGASEYLQAHLCWARAHLRLADGAPGALADAVACLEVAEARGMTQEALLAAQLSARAAAAEGRFEVAWGHERRARELTAALHAARRADAQAFQSSRMRAAELEAARDEARAVAEARSWVLKVVSHELRTPLSGILGATELLSGRLSAPEDTALLSLIRTSGELMLSLVSSLLDAARLEAGALSLSASQVSLPALLEETLSLLGPAAAEKALSLSLRLRAGLPTQVTLDGRRLQQIVLNLAANAVKFTPSGAVTVTAAPSGAGAVEIVVDDDGPGVAPADQARIFEPFAQAEMGSTRRYGGAGLGLAITQQLASLFGGQITVGDAPGGGARFTLTLPAEGAAPLTTDRTVQVSAPQPPARPAAAASSAVSVLLVDDDVMCRSVHQAMLRRLGAEVRSVASGAQALDAARVEAPDLILLDWMMPQMDGAEVAAALRQRGCTAPILVLTASPDPDLDQRRGALDIQAIYTKPVGLDTMSGLLQEWGRPSA